MKILIVQDYLRSGGTERQSILLTRAFTEAGHPTTLVTFRPGGALSHLCNDLDVRSLQPFDLHLDWFAPGLSATVERIRPNLILCMGRMANCFAGDLQINHPDIPVIGTLRTGKPLPLLFRRSLKKVRHIVANSHEARDNLVHQHRVSPSKITVIHNSLVFPSDDQATATSSRQLLRTEHGATPATTILLNVAMFRPEKNQRELIHLAAGLPANADWQLWLAGDGVARAECERLTAQLKLTARVRFLGFHRDPAPFYAAADIAVHASSSESLSNFLIEAQAHGLPAVAYAAQGISECFIPGQTGWVIPRDDRAAFITAITPLFSATPTDRSRISAQARTYARTTFDPARQVSAYLDLFTRFTTPLS
jgi:glycosyltransferase involved in cell wall biosynthesis